MPEFSRRAPAPGPEELNLFLKPNIESRASSESLEARLRLDPMFAVFFVWALFQWVNGGPPWSLTPPVGKKSNLVLFLNKVLYSGKGPLILLILPATCD